MRHLCAKVKMAHIICAIYAPYLKWRIERLGQGQPFGPFRVISIHPIFLLKIKFRNLTSKKLLSLMRFLFSRIQCLEILPPTPMNHSTLDHENRNSGYEALDLTNCQGDHHRANNTNLRLLA